MSPQTPAVGVDGWKDGWVAAVAIGRRVEWRAYRQPRQGVRTAFASVLAEHVAHPIALDMPIGTTEGPREADSAARAFLRDRGGQWQSIFLAPTTSVVQAFERSPRPTHGEVMAEQRARGLPGTSIQSWNLIAKIIEVRDALDAAPGANVVEAHPECSLRLLAAEAGVAIGRDSKKTGRGVGLRLRALRAVFDLDLADAPPDVPVDDLLDACTLAWTARRCAQHRALALPRDASQPPRIVI